MSPKKKTNVVHRKKVEKKVTVNEDIEENDSNRTNEVVEGDKLDIEAGIVVKEEETHTEGAHTNAEEEVNVDVTVDEGEEGHEPIVISKDIGEEDDEDANKDGVRATKTEWPAPINSRNTVPRLKTTDGSKAKSVVRTVSSSIRRSPPRTRGFTSTATISAVMKASMDKKKKKKKKKNIEDDDEEEYIEEANEIQMKKDKDETNDLVEDHLIDEQIEENEVNECSACGLKFPLALEMIEHQRANHAKEFDHPRTTGTLMCAHPHCGHTLRDMHHMVSHLAGFHNQTQYRFKQLNFQSEEQFSSWKAATESASKCQYMAKSNAVETSPGISELEMYCDCSDEWRHMDSTKDLNPIIACPAHFTVTFDRNKDKVSLIGCISHLGHLKKPHWNVYVQEDPTQRKVASAVKTKCHLCGEWFRSRTALTNHRKLAHPSNIRNASLMCGDPSCDVVLDTMLSLCEHVADTHKREDLVVEEYRFNSVQDFEVWKERMEADTMSFFTKVSGRQRAAASGPNSECFFRYYQCHLSGYNIRPSVKKADPNFELNRVKLRNRGTKKMNRFCTAFMNIKINDVDGSVLLKGCLGHYGHDCDIRRVPLPNSLRAEIIDLLQKGVTEDDVLAIIKGKASAHERAFYLQKYEVKNIIKKLIKESNGAMYYKYDDEEERHEIGEDEELGVEWTEMKRPFTSTMYRPDLAHPKRRHIGAYAMQFSGPLQRKRRLVYRPENDPNDVGAEDYYETVVEEMPADMEETIYLEDVDLSQPCSSTSQLHRLSSHHPSSSNARKVELMASRTPLLKDSSLYGRGKEFDITIQNIQDRIKIMSDQLKKTKDVNLAATMLEEVRSLEHRMSRLIPQTKNTPTTTYVKRGNEFYEVAVDGDGEEVEYYDMMDRSDGRGMNRQYVEDDGVVYEMEMQSPGNAVDVEDLDEMVEDGQVIHSIQV